jgi:hypothetical protein
MRLNHGGHRDTFDEDSCTALLSWSLCSLWFNCIYSNRRYRCRPSHRAADELEGNQRQVIWEILAGAETIEIGHEVVDDRLSGFELTVEAFGEAGFAEAFSVGAFEIEHAIGVHDKAGFRGEVKGFGVVFGEGIDAEDKLGLHGQWCERAAAAEERWIVAGGGDLQLPFFQVGDGDEHRDELADEDLRAELAVDLFEAGAGVADAHHGGAHEELGGGHQKRGGHAVTGDVTDGEDEAFVRQFKPIVEITTDVPRRLIDGGDFDLRRGQLLLR